MAIIYLPARDVRGRRDAERWGMGRTIEEAPLLSEIVFKHGCQTKFKAEHEKCEGEIAFSPVVTHETTRLEWGDY